MESISKAIGRARSLLLFLVLCSVLSIDSVGAADIRYDSSVIVSSRRTYPLKRDQSVLGSTKVSDGVYIVNDDVANEPTIIIPSHRNQNFNGSWFVLTHFGEGDKVAIRIFGSSCDSLPIRYIWPEADSLQQFFYPGQFDSLRIWKVTDTATTRVHFQAG